MTSLTQCPPTSSHKGPKVKFYLAVTVNIFAERVRIPRLLRADRSASGECRRRHRVPQGTRVLRYVYNELEYFGLSARNWSTSVCLQATGVYIGLYKEIE